jgi:DNA-binding XRE family transcriptional regulator
MRSEGEARSIRMKERNRAVNRVANSVRGAANNVRVLREEQLLTKAELARKAGISALTLARIESGCDCRVDTKRKIILALGLKPTDRHKVFGGANGVRKGR